MTRACLSRNNDALRRIMYKNRSVGSQVGLTVTSVAEGLWKAHLPGRFLYGVPPSCLGWPPLSTAFEVSLGFKNTLRQILLSHWLQMAGESERWAFHINIDNFFLSFFFPLTIWNKRAPKISGVNREHQCAHLHLQRMSLLTQRQHSHRVCSTQNQWMLYTIQTTFIQPWVKAIYFHLSIK